MIRIGLVDFDTSHVAEFTQRINHVGISADDFIEGARIVAGFPGDSAMMPERIPGYVSQLTGYGVPIVDRLEDLFDKIDAVMIESQQSSRHLDRARPFLEMGMPTFVDKPFAADAADAEAILELAQRYGAPLMACSSLRYAPEVIDAVARQAELGRLLTADVWTPCALHEGNPGLQHYGIHGVETLYTLMGPGCVEVRTVFTPGGEVVTGLWNDGRVGVVRGLRLEAYAFGFAAHYEKGHHTVTAIPFGPFYTGMLRRIVQMFEDGVPPIPYSEIREITAFMDAALASQNSGGAPARLTAGPLI